MAITVTDANDNIPTFSPTIYSVNVLETANFGPGVVLKQVTISDNDEGINADITIVITSGNDEGKFAISGVSFQYFTLH